MNDMNKKISFNKKISRREALSTAGKIAISAVVAGVVAGVGGYLAGSAAAPAKTITETKTVTAAAATVTQTVTQTVTKTVTAPTTLTTTAPPPTTTVVTTVPTTGKEPLTLWHLWTEGTAQLDWLRTYANKFNSENPRVYLNPVYVENEVFKRQIVTAMSAGNPPDIFHNWGGWMYLFRFAKEGLVYDITPFMEKESPYIPGVPWKDTLLPGRIAQVTFTDGRIYAVPLMLLFESMFFNRKLFEKYNVTMPTNDWTWDEFLDIIEEIKRKAAGEKIYPIALGNAVGWTGMIYLMYFVLRLLGADYVERAMWDPKLRYDTKEFVEAARLCQDLVDRGAFNPGFNGLRDTDAAMLFANGQAFMEAIGTWIYGQALAYNKENPKYFDVVAWPHFKGEKDSNNLVGGGDAYAIAKVCKHPEDAVRFLQLFVSPESQKMLLMHCQILPTLKTEYLGLTEEEKAKIPDLAKHEMELASKATYICNYWDQGLPPVITEAVLESVVAIFGKTMTPEDFANKLESARQKWLEEAGIA
jgi:raffinose/stachyose/melibiose transport system substrate-binding protein